MEDKDRFVDELLDSALAHHRDAEPRAGLEGRILAHVRATASERSAQRKAWRLWAAAAAIATVMVFVAIYASNRAPRSVPQTSLASNTVPAPSPTETLKASSGPTPATRPATKVAEPKRVARSEPKPSRRVEAHHWPSQFPTPAPLTPEEKALVRYVQETPPQVLAASLSKAQSLDQPVEIKPLKIAPLEIQPLSLGSANREIQ